MPWIDVVAEDEATGDVKAAYDRVVKERGKLSGIMLVQGLRPEAMLRHLELYVELSFGESGLTRAERELIAVVVSSANGCEYCVRHHARPLGVYWKDDARVEVVVRDWRAADLTDRERALAAYADKLTRAPADMIVEDVAALRAAGLSDRDVLDVNTIAAYFNFANRVVAGLGVEFSAGEVEGYKT
jgi:uncharacterized peroxidase-related enzyme